MRLVSAWTPGTALCALLALCSVSPAAAATDPACAHPDALWALEYKKEALKAYGRLASTEQCARDALIAIKSESDAENAKAKAEDDEAKAKSLENGAENDPLLDQVRALRAAGLTDEAKEQLKAWTKRYPGDEPPGDLRTTPERTEWWQRALSDYSPTARSVTEAVAVGMAVLAVLLVLWRGLGFRPNWVRRRLLHTVRIETPAKQDGLSTALTDHLRQFNQAGAGGNAKFVGPSEGEFKLPDNLVSAFAPAGLIASLVNVLRKIRPMRVASVSLRPADPQRGLGVTVGLRGGTKAETTIWESDFELRPAAPDDKSDEWRLQRLMLPVAAWLAYALDQSKPPQEPLGSDDWRSYAHFAVGAVFQRQGELDVADKQYQLALDRCPGNRGARLNLAGLRLSTNPPAPRQPKPKRLDPEMLLRWPTESRFEALPELLPDDPQRLLDHLESWPDKGPEGALVWRARYVRAVAFAYRGCFRAAACDLKRLTTLLAGESDDPDTELLRKRLHRLRDVFYDSVLLEDPEQGSPSPPKPDPSWESAAGYYNLACYWARSLRRIPDKQTARREEATELALLFLAHALRHAGNPTRAAARKDPALQALADEPAFAALTKQTPRPKTEASAKPAPAAVG